MKKLLLLICALLGLGTSGAWATTKTWDSGYSAQGDKVNATWIGFAVPAGVTTGTYNMTLDLCMWPSGGGGSNVARSTYIGVFNSKTPSEGSLVGFSVNKPEIPSDGYVTYCFNSLNLTGGTTYYLFFLESTDSYTTTTNRIALTSSGNSYTPAMSWGGKEYTNYAPLFKAVISDDAKPIAYSTHTGGVASSLYPGTFYASYGSTSVAETTTGWGNLWVSNPAPIQVAMTCNASHISGFSGFFQATTTQKTFTLKALGQYKIKGLRLTALAERDGGGDCTVTITKPDDTTADFNKASGTTVMIDATLATSATTTTFKVECNQSDGRLKNVELVVLLETDDNKISSISDLGVFNIKMNNYNFYYITPSSTNGTFASAAQVQLISTGTANEYYLYSISDKKFLADENPDTQGTSKDSKALSLKSSIAEATPFVITPDKIPYQYSIKPSTSTTPYYLTAWWDYQAANICNFTLNWNLSQWQFMKNSYDSKALIQTYMTEKSVGAVLSVANQLGFPKTTSASYILLKNLTDSINNTSLADTWRYNADIYTRLQSYYTGYLKETDIVMPTDGKVYSFINVQKDGTTKHYLENVTGTLTGQTYSGGDLPETAEFVCHKVADNKFVFLSKSALYLQGAYGGNSLLSSTYNGNYCDVEISHFTLGEPVFQFGKVNIKTTYRYYPPSTDATVFLMNSNGTWNTSKSALLSDDEGKVYSSAYQIIEANDYYNKVTLTTDNTDAYASLYLPFSVTIPSGITAYKVTSQNGEYAHMESIVTNGILPKETPAILKKAGQTENLTVYLSPATGAGDAVAGNLLGGTVAAAEAKPGSGTTYVLGKIGGVIGLYEYTPTNLAPGKAYLNVAAGVKALAFDFGDTDGIKALENGQLKMDNAHIFNLAGQRMNKLQRGVNIVNGKKIIVK